MRLATARDELMPLLDPKVRQHEAFMSLVLLARVVQQGYTVFWTHSITTSVYLDPARIDRGDIEGNNFDYLAAQNLLRRLKVQDDELGLASGEAMDLVSRDLGYRITEKLGSSVNFMYILKDSNLPQNGYQQ